MKFHPFSEIFPLLEGPAFDELVEDVREHGVREPVWLYEGAILDGRNRYRAAECAGREAQTRNYEGTRPLEFVISLNMRRRHLDASQLSLAAAKIANLREGRPPAKTESRDSVSLAEAAKMMKVGRASVQRARKVIEQAAPEVARAVERGEIKVNVAADIAAAPKEEQVKAVAEGAAAVKQLRAKLIKPARAAAEQKREKEVAQDSLLMEQERRQRVVRALRDFIFAIETKSISPREVFNELPAWQLVHKGVLLEFLGKVAKLAVVRIKKADKQQRAWRKRRKRERIAANKRMAVARRKAKAKASKNRKRIRTVAAHETVRRPARRTGATKQRRSGKPVSPRVTRRLSHPSVSI